MLTIEERNKLATYVKENNLQKVNLDAKGVHLKKGIYLCYVKRLIDIVVSIFALIITFPINVIIGIGIFFDVGNPIFFRQERPGKDEKIFTMIKFRSMTNEKDERGNLLPISKRVTRFGSFVRRTSLDELLNFWSILKGDMSVIGPRPLATIYLDRYSERHRARHMVRPGLECPNLKFCGYGHGWHEQFENDVWYVENVSFFVDCKMLLCLIRMVFDKDMRKNHAVTGAGDFIGYDDIGIAFGANNIPPKYLELVQIGEK